MFNFFAEVMEIDGALKAVKEAVRELESQEVLVGIPEEEGSRPVGDTISNAELLYIHTHGSPVNNIPPRVVVEDAIEHDKETVADLLQGAADAALSGDKAAIVPALDKAGMYGQNIARGWFTNPANGWAPNNPSTVKRKGSSRPLIDTGELRKSITYKVRKV